MITPDKLAAWEYPSTASEPIKQTSKTAETTVTAGNIVFQARAILEQLEKIIAG